MKNREVAICVRISRNAIDSYNLLFGRLKKIEMAHELSYYIKEHEKVGRFKKDKELKLNYDGKCFVILERVTSGGWVLKDIEAVSEDVMKKQRETA